MEITALQAFGAAAVLMECISLVLYCRGLISGVTKDLIFPCTPLEWAESNNTGESRKLFFERVLNTWNSVIENAKNNNYKTIIIVSHRSVFSAIESYIAGGDADQAIELRKSNNNKRHGLWNTIEI